MEGLFQEAGKVEELQFEDDSGRSESSEGVMDHNIFASLINLKKAQDAQA